MSRQRVRPTLRPGDEEPGPFHLVRPPGTRWDFAEVFGRRAPIEAEIGSGKGEWLVEAAAAAPDRDFVGVEMRRRLARYVALRLKRRGLGNARIVLDDAWQFLAERVPPASFAAIHLYFPDPWWKSRHRRRRVYRPEFFAQVERALLPGGQLRVASDVDRVHDDIVAAVGAGSGLVLAPDHFATSPAVLLSNFARKAGARGAAIQAATFERSAPGVPVTG